jgi:hypothetical protein
MGVPRRNPRGEDGHDIPVSRLTGGGVLDAHDLGVTNTAHLDAKLALGNGAADAIATLAGKVVDAGRSVTSLYR